MRGRERWELVAYPGGQPVSRHGRQTDARLAALRHASSSMDSVELWELRRGERHRREGIFHPPGTTARVVLLGCSKQKLDHPAPARELYASPLFRRSLAFAETLAPAERIFIVSGQHGLVAPDDVLRPYDARLSTRPALERGWWANQIAVDLEGRMRRGFAPPGIHVDDDRPALRGLDVVLLMGRSYAGPIADAIPSTWTACQPLDGLEVGERLRWLNRALARHARAQKGRAR